MLTELTSGLRLVLLAALGAGVSACGGSAEESDAATGRGGRGGGAGDGSEGGISGAPAGGAANREPRRCTPQPNLVPNSDVTICNEGYVRRDSPTSCAYEPRDSIDLPPSVPTMCSSDLDCTEKAFGYCTYTMGGTRCEYGCGTDEDCGAGSVCVCGTTVGTCAPASCTRSTDCGDRLCLGVFTTACSPSPPPGQYVFACDDPRDECLASSECVEGEQCTEYASGNRCEVPTVACGRPFLIGGFAQQARAEGCDRGWGGSSDTSELAVCSPIERALLAEHWTQVALMEHASVAAFARFALELLALGAPSGLLRETQRALGDEIAHAELCFAIASNYAGRPVQPGHLAMEGALSSVSLEGIVKTAFLEACIGETVAALDAQLASEGARDMHIRSTLTRIAADETRHAELGWSFLKWALNRCSDAERGALVQELAALLEKELSAAAALPCPSREPALVRFGVPSPQQRHAARIAALRDVVLPCAAALGIPSPLRLVA